MGKIDIVAVGASAGGVEALSSFVESLPGNLDAAVFAVLHFPENATSVLPRILNRSRTLIAKHPEDGDAIQKSHVYIAPPGCHMLVKSGKIRVIRGPKENGHRPAIDPTFRTAARVYGSRVAGVILSGLLDDGVVGMSAIRFCGGMTLVQDPAEAMFPDMPKNTMAAISVDKVAPIAQLAAVISEAAGANDLGDLEIKDGVIEDQLDLTEMGQQELREYEKNGKPSVYTCPECAGTLFPRSDHPGFHPVSVTVCCRGMARQTEELEAALWEALRSMEENLALARSMLERAIEGRRGASAEYYNEKVRTGEKRVTLLRNVLHQDLAHMGNTDGP